MIWVLSDPLIDITCNYNDLVHNYVADNKKCNLISISLVQILNKIVNQFSLEKLKASEEIQRK